MQYIFFKSVCMLHYTANEKNISVKHVSRKAIVLFIIATQLVILTKIPIYPSSSVYFYDLCLLPLKDASFLLEQLSEQCVRLSHLSRFSSAEERDIVVEDWLRAPEERKILLQHLAESLVEISWHLCSKKDRFLATCEEIFSSDIQNSFSRCKSFKEGHT